MVFSWDAYTARKTSPHPFSVSTYGARLIVVRDEPNDDGTPHIKNVGWLHDPRSIAVFARLVAHDNERAILDNDNGVEPLIGDYLECPRETTFTILM